MPPTARPAPRGERRGTLVLTAGPVPYFYGRYPAGPVDVSRFVPLGADGWSCFAPGFLGRAAQEPRWSSRDSGAPGGSRPGVPASGLGVPLVLLGVEERPSHALDELVSVVVVGVSCPGFDGDFVTRISVLEEG